MRNQLKRKPKKKEEKEEVYKMKAIDVITVIIVIIGLLLIMFFGTPVKDYYPGKPPWIDLTLSFSFLLYILNHYIIFLQRIRLSW